jgi:hypothetical protein
LDEPPTGVDAIPPSHPRRDLIRLSEKRNRFVEPVLCPIELAELGRRLRHVGMIDAVHLLEDAAGVLEKIE